MSQQLWHEQLVAWGLEANLGVGLLSFAPLHRAGPQDLSFWRGNQVHRRLVDSKAGLILVDADCVIPPALLAQCQGVVLRIPQGICGGSAETALEALFDLWHPWERACENYVDPSASVHPTACVEGFVGPGAKIGAMTWVAPGAYVGAECVVDARVVLEAGVVLGPRCWIQSGAVLGPQGFGFAGGLRQPGRRLVHYGGVVLGEGVQIGPQTHVASGRFEPTRIGDFSCLDALIQVGHHVQIGNHTHLAALVALAGGVEIGNHVLVGGASAFQGHVRIGDGAVISGRSGVTKDVPPALHVSGFPALPHREWLRMQSSQRHGS
jgi:UDP-3-O-[3-hydroxymyristoyl] glucosamine N-acyltransferase